MEVVLHGEEGMKIEDLKRLAVAGIYKSKQLDDKLK